MVADIVPTEVDTHRSPFVAEAPPSDVAVVEIATTTNTLVLGHRGALGNGLELSVFHQSDGFAGNRVVSWRTTKIETAQGIAPFLAFDAGPRNRRGVTLQVFDHATEVPGSEANLVAVHVQQIRGRRNVLGAHVRSERLGVLGIAVIGHHGFHHPRRTHAVALTVVHDNGHASLIAPHDIGATAVSADTLSEELEAHHTAHRRCHVGLVRLTLTPPRSIRILRVVADELDAVLVRVARCRIVGNILRLRSGRTVAEDTAPHGVSENIHIHHAVNTVTVRASGGDTGKH